MQMNLVEEKDRLDYSATEFVTSIMSCKYKV